MVRNVRDKQAIREFVWERLDKARALNSGRVYDRIPDFKSSAAAAILVCELDVWKQASVVKSNPDKAQRPLRQYALEGGKIVYMAVPRLREERCFVALEASLGASAETLSTIEGAMKYGRLVSLEEMRSVDLVISGSVAVNREGIRIGKGGGFADLEYAMAVSVGVVNNETPVLTTVHDLQILDEQFPSTRHDVSMDYIVTENEIINCNRQIPRPNGIYWEDLEASKIQEIPLLMKLSGELNNKKGQAS